jgi:hypothetical protein
MLRKDRMRSRRRRAMMCCRTMRKLNKKMWQRRRVPILRCLKMFLES